jgi:hypothetical protein
MKVQAEIRYPRPPADVSVMLADPDFQDAKCKATGALRHAVDVTADGDRLRISTERELPTDRFPDFVKSFVGSSLTVNQVDDWDPPGADGSRTGSITVTVSGAPIRLTGTQRLTVDGTGARTEIVAEVKAKIPLIGGRVEKAAEPAIMGAVKAEQKVASTWLAT